VSDPSSRLKLELFHPPVEIERKFLIANDDWRRSVIGSVAIRDGMVALYKDRKVRVRISEGTATITLKGPRAGIRRDEFEYEIPLADAERMLAAICDKEVLEKRRYFVEATSAIWFVDVYSGVLDGVMLAEIELRQENETPVLPSWIGREVTGDLRYRKFNLLAMHGRRQPEPA
jgi:CYTH domain-containing protein